MKPSVNAIKLIKKFEKLRLKSYKAVSTEKMYTIGWGHYGVGANLTITKFDADVLLVQDMKKAQKAVDKYASLYSFNQNQYDALISFAYNVGSIDGLTAEGFRSKYEISKAIPLYNKSGGKVVRGLKRRRKLELKRYNKPCK
jgi:GH24 family phage-related lysozyme (muramidase)